MLQLTTLAIIFTFALITGCSGTSNQDQATEQDNQAKTTESAYQQTTVKLTDHYSYTLPEGFEEANEDFDETASEAKCFANGDGSRQIRSWVYEGHFEFPYEAEAMADGDDIQIGYGGIYDTAIARITDSKVENGTRIYRTLFVWPDGADRTCFVDLASTEEDYLDFESRIRGSIRNSDPPEGTGTYGFEEQTPGAPTDEDIDRAMLREAQDAYEE